MLYLGQNGPVSDTSVVLAFIAKFYRTFDVPAPVAIDAKKVVTIIRDMDTNFPYPGGSENASPFKKIAQFVCYFVAHKPIGTPLPDEAIGSVTNQGEKVARSNAVIALAISVESLHNAVLTWKDGSKHILKNRIQLSSHSFADIVEALSDAKPPSESFKLVTVLLEQVAYKTNPECQYPIPP